MRTRNLCSFSVEDVRENCPGAVHSHYGESTLTASAGIAPNKMLAKVASGRNKSNGQYSTREGMLAFIHGLLKYTFPGNFAILVVLIFGY